MKRTEIEWMPIGCIKPYDRNPRKNDGAVEALANSITEFGFKNPIIVDKDLVIIAGHTRLKAAKLLGLKEVPVVVASDLSEAQTRAYRLADNKIGELAEWDDDLLQEELDALDDEFDMEDFGFEAEIADDLQIMETMDEPPIPETPEEPISKPGDIWRCGDHLVMCGDATNPYEMARLISNSSQRGEIVLDPFGGSGSTLLACESLGRRCRTMELDPRYCDVIIKRWEEQTGKKAVLT